MIRVSGGLKAYADDLTTNEVTPAHLAVEKKPYWSDGYCYVVRRVNAVGTHETSFYRYYGEGDDRMGPTAPPKAGGGGNGPSIAHELAIRIICEQKSVGVVIDGKPAMVLLSSAVLGVLEDELIPDLTGTVENCYPPTPGLLRGDRIHIEICLANPVMEGSDRYDKIQRRREATLEVALAKQLARIDDSIMLANELGFMRSIRRELIRCPRGKWLCLPNDRFG